MMFMAKIIRKLEDVEVFDSHDISEYGKLRMRGLSREQTINKLLRGKR